MGAMPAEEPVSLEAFTANLRRYYEADAMSAEEIRHFYGIWQEFISDAEAVKTHESLFRSPTPPTAGLAWWEERWADLGPGPDGIRPIDRVNMLLSADVRVDLSLVPRPHRPGWMRGHWRFLTASGDEELRLAPTEAREVLLPAAGLIEVHGPDPDQLGGTLWSVRWVVSGWVLDLWMDGYRHSIWMIEKQEPDQVTLTPIGQRPPRYILARVEGREW